MTRPSVHLLMAIHCHQPVGNFGFVFEEAFAKSYDPFLGVLERHPGVRLALHYSGCLLDWLAEHRPEFLARVRALVARGQVELLASGYYEPILPVIPEDDRQGQIAQMRHALRRRFGEQAEGLWLTERVWEPELPRVLAAAGIRYTMIDVNQFAGARPWLPSGLQVHDDAFWDVLGCYTTDDAGSSVILFPASKRLRYWMPFQGVEQTIDWLRRLQRDEPAAVTFADDGEKFGLWPKTHRWVYEEGWLDQFFTALEREQGWLATSTFQAYLHAAKPNGHVYLPSGSYEEMLEWSGGYFRNFFTKYPEANAMYQRMLRTSRAIQQVVPGSGFRRPPGSPKPRRKVKRGAQNTELLRRARQELYAGQCNCAYWHGVFGGLYLSHLRRAVYAHLIAAEALLDGASNASASLDVFDTDGDGLDEHRLRNSTISAVVDPAEGGTVTEWDVLKPALNLLDTLSRRHEPYHEKLRAKQVQAVESAGKTPASIHDVLGVKEENLAAHLVYDDHRRSSFLDYGFESAPSLQEVARATWGERQVWAGGVFHVERAGSARARDWLRVVMARSYAGGTIRKTVQVHRNKPILECGYQLTGVDAAVIGLEFNVSLRDARYMQAPQETEAAARLTLQEPGMRVALHATFDPPARLLHFPVETVSESEEGLERTYQGLCLVCFWIPEVRGITRTWTGRVQWTVEAT